MTIKTYNNLIIYKHLNEAVDWIEDNITTMDTFRLDSFIKYEFVQYHPDIVDRYKLTRIQDSRDFEQLKGTVWNNIYILNDSYSGELVNMIMSRKRN